jgi:hypothetical protein
MKIKATNFSETPIYEVCVLQGIIAQKTPVSIAKWLLKEKGGKILK